MQRSIQHRETTHVQIYYNKNIYTYIFVPLRGMHPPHPPTAISECCIYVTKSQNLELNNSNVVCGFIFPYLHVICSCINKNDSGRPFYEGDIISVTATPFRWWRHHFGDGQSSIFIFLFVYYGEDDTIFPLRTTNIQLKFFTCIF